MFRNTLRKGFYDNLISIMITIYVTVINHIYNEMEQTCMWTFAFHGPAYFNHSQTIPNPTTIANYYHGQIHVVETAVHIILW